MNKLVKWVVILVVLAFSVLVVACGEEAEDKAQHRAEHLNSQIYIPQHNIEFRNYNLRQKVSDNPATILWCTFFPPGVQNTSNGSTPGQAITVPIAGKLTSSSKRPYENEPGPDAMYGSSVQYRYGFDPSLTRYYDFTELPSFCTTEPLVWQTQETKVIVKTDTTATSISRAAEAAVKKGHGEEAFNLLGQIEHKSEGK